MRIPSQSFPASLQNRLQQLTAQQTQLQDQVSSGRRITRPSDDPGAMGRVLNLQAEQQQLLQWSKNSERATEISQSSYSAVDGLKKISDRAGELATLGTGTLGGDASKAYGAEADQMLEQALQTANSQFSGEHLFGGTKTDTAPFTATRDAAGKITGITYNGTADTPELRLSEGAKISPYVSGSNNAKMADFLNRLVSLRDALQSGDSSAVQSTRSGLATSEDDLLVTMSDIGAVQTRLETSEAQNEARSTELKTLTGKEANADMADSIVQLNQVSAMYEAALQSGAKVMQMSLLDYIR